MRHAAAGRTRWLAAVAVFLITPWNLAGAQIRSPLSSRELVPFDITGYWVSLITEEWVQRMTTPPRGDYRFVPLNAAGRAQADNWDPAADEAAGEACRSYAAPAIMRSPSRLQIDWQDDSTLRVNIDSGTQTRFYHFGESSPGEPSWQGHSVARWEVSEAQRDSDARAGERVGTLHVDTTNLRAGYLLKNGVPFSTQTFMTEYYELIELDDGSEYLVVQIFVDDPVYLSDHWVGTVHFRREPDGNNFKPTTCSAY